MDALELLDHLVKNYEPKRFYHRPSDLLMDFARCYKEWFAFYASEKERPDVGDCAITACCKAFGVTKEMLLGHSRRAFIVEARHTAMYLLERYTTLSLHQIAQCVNRKDHGTVMHGVGSVKARLSNERGFPTKVNEAEQAFFELYGVDEDLKTK